MTPIKKKRTRITPKPKGKPVVSKLKTRRAGQALQFDPKTATYRLIAETSSEGIWILDENSYTTFVNKQMADMLGYSVDEMIGKPADTFLFEEDLKDNEKREDAREKGFPECYRRRLRGKNGAMVWTWVSATPMMDPQKQFRGSFAMFTDVTEKKLTEDVLGQEKDLLRALIDTIPDNIYFKDNESRFIRISKAMSDWLGLSDLTEAIGKTDFDFFTEEHARPAYECEQEIIRTGRPLINLEEKETWPDRPETWASTTKMPLKDKNGNIIGTFGISRDITERKRLEEALRQEQNLLQNLLDTVPDHIFFKDVRSRFIRMNLAHARMLGLSDPREAVGKTDFDLFEPAFAQKAFEEEQGIIRTGKAVVGRIWEMTYQTGQRVWLSETKMPLRDKDGRIIGLMGISRDITELKGAETALRQSEEAQRAFAERLTRVLEAVNTLSQIESFEALCRRSVELAIELLGFDRIGLWFLSEDKQTMLGAYGTDEKGVLRDERNIQGPVDLATVRRLLESDDPVVFFERHELRNHEGEVVGTGSQATAKLWNGEEVIGLLNVDNLMRRNPITGEDQRILYLYATALAHLFTLKRTEAALKESEDRFRALFDQAAVGVAQIETATGRFLKVNRRVCDIVGYAAEELESLTIRDITHSDDLQADLNNMKLLAEKKIREYSVDKRFHRKDGSAVWVNQTVSTMSTDREKQSCEITVVQDITERKRMEERIRNDIREKEVLLKEIHHRVKNNMQVIVSLLRMQSEQIEDPDIQEKFKTSEDRIYSMSLVHEMLYGSKELSKIEFNRYVETLAGNLFESFGVGRGRIALELDMEPIELDVYDAIPCGLILQELVSNVLKYAFPKDWTGESKVRIGLRRADGKVELSIADTGKGMPELDIGKLKSLGFKLVNVLADQLGGDIRVKRGKGTEITLRFEEGKK